MYHDSFKIRISHFAQMVLDYDAGIFGFIHRNERSNINGLINKLVPILLEKRKERRNLIHDTLDEAIEFRFNEMKADKLRYYIDSIMDRIYFAGEEYDSDLSDEIWIRPSQKSAHTFDEIKDSETDICQLNRSDYLRGLLNEYVRLPQFRREQILFSKELVKLIDSIHGDNICGFNYDNKKYKAVILLHWIEPFETHNNYVFFYDIEHDLIKVALLHEISDVYLRDRKKHVDDTVLNKLDDIFETRAFIENDTFEIER